jgi:uncharacterized protein YxjI
MKEKIFSLTGDDFTIKTTAGVEVCRCKGKVLSISDKKLGLMRHTNSAFLVLIRCTSG